MVMEVLLTTLAVLQAAPFPSPNLSRDLVAFFMGRRSGAKNSGFKCDMAAASKKGYIVYPNAQTVRITASGLAHVQKRVGKPPQSNEDIHDHLLEALDGHRTKRLFAMLSDGQVHTREAVARELGFSSCKTSGFKCYCATESRRGLIYYPSTTTMALHDFAFPFGRPSPTSTKKKTGTVLGGNVNDGEQIREGAAEVADQGRIPSPVAV